MYLPVKLIQIEKAIRYFLCNASSEDQEQAELCLKPISSDMVNTFIKFEDQYWLYRDDKLVKEKGLTIGEYESVGLAYLVAAWILEQDDRRTC